MAAFSSIEWTEATWNPIAGCTIVSPGCTNCYAMRMAGRLQAMGHAKYRGTTRKSGARHVWTGRITLDMPSLEIPATWAKPLRIFVNSMSDLFHEKVPPSFIAEVWDVMERANWHTYQILTKRPERMARILSCHEFKVLPNVWVGTSVETCDYLHRVDALRTTPAAVRFISFEPLLGPIVDADLSGIDWVIVGGESGPRSRPIERAWIDDIKRSCTTQGTAFFFKQWGGRNRKASGRQLDDRTWDEFPAVKDFVVPLGMTDPPMAT